jgi:iron-sulfur cluster insertion protein
MNAMSETSMPMDLPMAGQTPVSPEQQRFSLSKNAIKKTKELMGLEANQGKNLRVYVEGGGCSGYQYGFMFDTKRDGDIPIEAEDINVYIDPKSLQFIKGCIIDYVDALTGAGYRVTNPNATGTC